MSNNRYTIMPQSFQKINARLLYISISRYEGDWKSIPHTHHFAELIYVVGGEGFFRTGKGQRPIADGDLIIISPNVEHTEVSCSANPLEYFVLGIDGVTFQHKNSEKEHLIYNYRQETSVPAILHLLLGEACDEKEGGSLVCQDLLEVLLIHIMRMQSLLPLPYTSTKMTRECGIIKRYLDSNYADSISLERLASLAHMNKYYLVHAFTKYTGLSPISYLNLRRLQAGKALLTGTNHSISQIASLTGFSSQSYFTQVFKKETGISPSQYRKTYLNLSC